MQELKISFKKSDGPLIKVKPTKETQETSANKVSSTNDVEKLLSGELRICSSKSIYKYLVDMFKKCYPNVPYVESIPVQRVYKCINTRGDLIGGKAEFVKLCTFFIENYSKKYANSNYPYPRVGQLEVNWLFEKVLNDYQSAQSIVTVSNTATNTPTQQTVAEDFKFY